MSQNLMDKILERTNLDYDDLTQSERDQLNYLLASYKSNPIGVPQIKEYISKMKEAVEIEVATTENNTKKDIFLKARLRNYILLESFLSTPERAQRAIEAALSGPSIPGR